MFDIPLPKGRVVDVIAEGQLLNDERYVVVNTSDRAVIYTTERDAGAAPPGYGTRPRVPLYPSQTAPTEWTIAATTKFYAWARGEDGVLTLWRVA